MRGIYFDISFSILGTALILVFSFAFYCIYNNKNNWANWSITAFAIVLGVFNLWFNYNKNYELREDKLINLVNDAKDVLGGYEGASAISSSGYILDRSKLELAKRLIDEALRIDADNKNALKVLGIVKWNLNFRDEALNIFIDLNKKHPNDEHIYNNLSLCYLEYNNLIEADKNITKAYSLNPKNHAIAANYAFIKLKQKKHNEAIGFCQDFLQNDSSNKRLHLIMGNCLAAKKEYKKAEKRLRMAIFINPKSPFAHNCLGNVLINLNRYEEAKIVIETAINLDPMIANSYNSLGVVYNFMKKDQLAIENFEKAIYINPNLKIAYENLLEIYRGKGMSTELNELEERIKKIQRDYSEAYRIMDEHFKEHENSK